MNLNIYAVFSLHKKVPNGIKRLIDNKKVLKSQF
jgi:hypothetical protein